MEAIMLNLPMPNLLSTEAYLQLKKYAGWELEDFGWPKLVTVSDGARELFYFGLYTTEDWNLHEEY